MNNEHNLVDSNNYYEEQAINRFSLRLRNKKISKCEKSCDSNFEICKSDDGWSLDENYVNNMKIRKDLLNLYWNKIDSNSRKVKKDKVKFDPLERTSKIDIHCNLCNFICPTKKSFERHKLNHFKQQIFQCRQCSETFTSNLKLISHIKTAHLEIAQKREQCQSCGKLVYNMNMHILQHNSARFQCEICGKQFVKHTFYTEHLLIHSGVRSFHCDICQTDYNRKWNWTIHLRNHEKNKDDKGNYLPLKPRGKGHGKYKKKEYLSVDQILAVKWDNVEKNSRSCGTVSLDGDLVISDDGIAMQTRDDQLFDKTPQARPVSNQANSTNETWNNVLFSSRSCDTSDMEFYLNFMREIEN